MKRFLITTALEETWTDEVPVLFLGEWCRLYERRARWSGMNAEVLPYHWEDFAKFDADYRYLVDFYERVLVEFGMQLNQVHGVDYDVLYWRTLIGTWLALFTQILYDRWCSVQRAVRSYELSETIVLTGNEDQWIPNDMRHFARLMTGDVWNHQIYAAILEQATGVSCIKKASTSPAVVPAAAKSSLKQRVVDAYGKAASRFVRDRDAFVIATFLPMADELRLQARLRQFPQVWRSVPVARVSSDPRQRNWVVRGASRNEFESFASSMIVEHLPTAYLEGYSRLVEDVRSLPWPRRPRLIFTSNALFNDTMCMAYTAERRAEGTRVVCGQHGGNFWTTRLHWGESHEVAIADRFLSWGFTDALQPKIEPVCYLKPLLPVRSSLERTTLLLVTQSNPRYSYSLFSGAKGNQVVTSYLEDAFAFVDAVRETCGDQLVVRLSPSNYGWDFLGRWRERFSDVHLDDGTAPMAPLAGGARMIVCTYCATTFFEAIASGIPAMMYWDLAVDPLTDSAVPSFKELESVGIFHRTPASAAEHVRAIWGDVDAWWASVAVRVVLERFKERYCRTPLDRLGRVEAALHGAVSASVPTPRRRR